MTGLGDRLCTGISDRLRRNTQAAPGGSERLWALSANEDAPLESRLDGEVGYGMALLGGRLTGTPNVGFGLSETARELRLGWRLSPTGTSAGGFELRLDAARRAGAEPEHRIGLGITSRW